MAECLGIYIEKSLIKYAKISKDHDNTKIEAFGINFYEKLEDALKQIIQETYSFKTPISVNISDEIYSYFQIFTMLSKKDIEKAIKTEFEFLCEERGYNKNALEKKYFTVANKEDNEKLRTIHIAANKAETTRKVQLFEGNKLKTMSPVPISITNLLDLKQKENVVIVNLEQKTEITAIIEGQIYNVDVIEQGMQEIFDRINLRENSYSKAYKLCKNTTIYTLEGKNLQMEENEYLDYIMPTLYDVVIKVKESIQNLKLPINKIYISGSGAIINNIDLYFEELITDIKCEILRPYFVQPEFIKVNIKDYIEVNSAIGLALQGLGEGLKEINFITPKFADRLPEWLQISNKEIKFNKFPKVNLNFDLSGELDYIEKSMLRVSGGILLLIIAYSVFSIAINNQIQQKTNEANASIENINSQIALVDKDINNINSRTSYYSGLIEKLQELSNKETERYRTKNAIPNLLNEIMFRIPKNVQITSIQNTVDTHIVINAQSEQYEELAIFKGKLILGEILTNVKSDTGVKQDGVVKVVIEGDLP